MNLKRYCATLTLTALLTTAVARAEYNAPADGKLTEKQVQSYVASMNDLREMWAAQGKKLENASTLGSISIASQTGEKWKEILAKHNLSEDEWSWVHEQTTRSWLVATMVLNAEQEIGKQKKEINDRIAAAKAKLAQQEAAMKSGKRTIRDDERAGMIEDFTNQQKNAREEVATCDEQAKNADSEAKEYDATAKAAEQNAKTPPTDVAADDRAAYIEEQKAQAASNREYATEARARETEAKQSAAAARKRADDLAKQIADPTLVLDPDEQASLKDQYQRQIDSTKAEITHQEEALAALAPAEAAHKEILDGMRQGIPQENLDLAKKYADQIAKAYGNEAQK